MSGKEKSRQIRCKKCGYTSEYQEWQDSKFICPHCKTEIKKTFQLEEEGCEFNYDNGIEVMLVNMANDIAMIKDSVCFEHIRARKDDICYSHMRLSDSYIQLADVLRKSFADSTQVNEVFRKAEEHMSIVIDIRERELKLLKDRHDEACRRNDQKSSSKETG